MQTAQAATVTAAADVWTVGALMFEAATGARVQQAGMQARTSAKGLYERAQAAEGEGTLGVLQEMVLESRYAPSAPPPHAPLCLPNRSPLRAAAAGRLIGPSQTNRCMVCATASRLLVCSACQTP